MSKYVNQELFFVLIELGFIAVNQADEDSALKLFRACKLLNPENSLPEVGEGYLHLHKLELTSAIETLTAVVKREPKNETAKTLLGVSLSLSPTKGMEGEKLLTEIAQSSGDSQTKKTAGAAIDFVDKFVKKEGGSPLQPKKSEKRA